MFSNSFCDYMTMKVIQQPWDLRNTFQCAFMRLKDIYIVLPDSITTLIGFNLFLKYLTYTRYDYFFILLLNFNI